MDSKAPEANKTRCTGCGRCVAACPQRLFTLEVSGYRKYAVMVRPQCCTCCLKCVETCPVGALTIEEEGA